jgi:very-short-patch-repair endonuclease
MQLNRSKDRRISRALRLSGWQVVRIWEHDLRGALPQVIERIRRCLSR